MHKNLNINPEWGQILQGMVNIDYWTKAVLIFVTFYVIIFNTESY